MGLDIYHFKATLKRPFVESPYFTIGMTEEDAPDFNVDLSYFSKYIHQIDYLEVVQTIVIVKSEQHFAHAQYMLKQLNHPILFHPQMEVLQGEIASIEHSYQLQGLEKQLSPGPPEWDLLHYSKVNKRTGFYYEELGYQKNGVNGQFRERFCRGDFHNFALLEDFQFAYDCIDFNWSSDTSEKVALRKQQFKRDFIDTYEQGASFISVSY